MRAVIVATPSRRPARSARRRVADPGIISGQNPPPRQGFGQI